MEHYETFSKKARQDLKVADHMLNVTYKFVGDPRMLVTIMQRLMNAVTNSMSAILYYERSKKRIPAFGSNFENMLNTFKARCARRYRVSSEYIQMIEELKQIMDEHKRSPVEFSRKDKFVICSNEYHMQVITAAKIKNYINKAKLFQTEIEGMI